MKKIVFSLLFSMTLFSCSKDETKTQDLVATRPTAPVLSPTVQIGTQVWMTRNLNVSRYSDGTPIPQVTNPAQWENLTTGAWCYYNNSATNGTTYGKLYNWYAVAGIYNTASLSNPALRKKLAPAGWHVPSNVEWTTLTTFLGGQNVAGGKMKAQGIIQAGTGLWNEPNTEATNSSGFTGLPAGFNYGGPFDDIGYGGGWWSSSVYDAGNAWICTLGWDRATAEISGGGNVLGFSVRCIKD